MALEQVVQCFDLFGISGHFLVSLLADSCGPAASVFERRPDQAGELHRGA